MAGLMSVTWYVCIFAGVAARMTVLVVVAAKLIVYIIMTPRGSVAILTTRLVFLHLSAFATAMRSRVSEVAVSVNEFRSFAVARILVTIRALYI